MKAMKSRYCSLQPRNTVHPEMRQVLWVSANPNIYERKTSTGWSDANAVQPMADIFLKMIQGDQGIIPSM